MARSIGSVTLSIGLVSIPMKLYTAQDKRDVGLHRLERETGARVKQPTTSSVTTCVACGAGRALAHDDLVSAYEHAPGAHVVFEADELKSLELMSDPHRIRIASIAPAATLEPSHVVRTVLLGPDKGGERAYHLLASLLAHRHEIAVGQLGARTRDQLVVVRPHPSGEGLVMHECLYPEEVREGTLAEVVPPGVVLSSTELGLASRLLGELGRPTFRDAIVGLHDGGAARLSAAVEAKIARKEIVVPPAADPGAALDLVGQLRASLQRPRKTSAVASGKAPRARRAS